MIPLPPDAVIVLLNMQAVRAAARGRVEKYVETDGDRYSSRTISIMLEKARAAECKRTGICSPRGCHDCNKRRRPGQ